MEEFFQDPPKLGNQYSEDEILKSYLRSKFTPEMLREIETDLIIFGGRVMTDIYEMGIEASENEPVLINYDTWGKRIDFIRLSNGWKNLDKTSAEEGLVAIGYERKYGYLSRTYQFAKLYLFTPSSAIYTCPLAMTDGAARIIEIYGDEKLKKSVLPRYISRDKRFITSGQWMTERSGGSDLSRTETIARLENGVWKLYGPKWFASAINAQTAMTLARIENEDGVVIEGSKGLSLFHLDVRKPSGRLNNITIHRLKDKLGTKALPTAELSLNGTPAIIVGEIGKGVKNIATMLNITRLYNAISAVSFMRRALAIAMDYAYRREAFGMALIDLPLHAEALAYCDVESQGAFYFAFYVIELLGKTECETAEVDEIAILRLLTPIVKLYTAKQAIAVVSELLECMGGAGYLEETGLPTILREVQVLSIWEGTTNVLSLDVLRSIQKEQTFEPFIKIINKKLSLITDSNIKELVKQVLVSLDDLKKYFEKSVDKDINYIQAGARNFAFAIAKITIATLLIEVAETSKNKTSYFVAKRWLEQNPINLLEIDSGHYEETSIIVKN